MESYLDVSGYAIDFSQEEIIKIGMDLAESKLSAENLSKMLERKAILSLIKFFETQLKINEN